MTIKNWNNYEINFGKYKGYTYAELQTENLEYLAWIVQTFEHDDIRWIRANAVIKGKDIPALDNTEVILEMINHEIAICASYEHKDICKNLSIRRWVKPNWICPIEIIDEVIEAFPGAYHSRAFLQAITSVHGLIQKSNATASDFNANNFGNGNEMYPFQKAGLEFIELTDGNALVADQMGLGKTIQALAYLGLHPEYRPVIIVCPASLKGNWEFEAKTWLNNDQNNNIEIINGGKLKTPTGDIVIINYDIIDKWCETLEKYNAQVIIFDESHYVKNSKSARSKTASKLSKDIPHKILLTGTPVLNRPAELWNQLQILKHKAYPDEMFFQWHKRFCDATQNRWGWDFSGNSNLEQLAESLKTVMIRRTKGEVLTELPEKQRTSIFIPIDNETEYKTADKDLREWIADNRDSNNYDKPSTGIEHLARIELLRQVAVKGKLKGAIDWIKMFLASGEKLVVFATHKKVISALMEAFGECAVKIDGSVPASKRQDIVNTFQTDDKVKLFVGNIEAAGVGITLTASSNVSFLELPWTPADLEQAEDRCHRISQKNAVNIYYLLAKGTIDKNISAMVERKRNVIVQITDDDKSLGFDLFDDDENNLKKI